jgi:integrase
MLGVGRLSELMPLDGAHLNAEGKALVSALAYSGMRPGEALALRSSDVGTKTLAVLRSVLP